jgi:alpha-beta hydrolase superfamily lysophospholipase
MANFMVGRSIASYALELKGFGRTESLKGHIDSLNTYIKDVRRLRNIIKKEHPHQRVFIAGESMGGLISFLTVIKKPALFRGLVCMSPGFLSRLKFTLLEYLRMVSARLYNPRKQFRMPFDGALCTSDPEMQKSIDTDELEHRFATPKLLHNILWGQVLSRLFKHRVRTDTLFLLAGDDNFVSSPASRKIFNGIKFKDKHIIEYPGMRHSLTAETGKEKVFEDVLKWIEKRL